MRPAPSGIRLLRSENVLEVTWDAGGPVTRYPVRQLRCECRCASCVDEFTGVRILDPATVPPDVGIKALRPVGNYALQFDFTDDHGTGLFTWDHLYMMEPDTR